MAKGKFITIEGGEGTGKSTQALLLAEKLRAAGHDATLTREPGGTPGGEEIRALLVSGEKGRWQPLSEAILHNAARHEHVTRVIGPALARGEWVVCDRFTDSTVAYQGHAQGVSVATVKELNRAASAGVLPDLTLILDLEVEAGLARAADRSERQDGADEGENRYEGMGRKFHESLRAAFLEIAAVEPDRCAVVDASGTKDEVMAAIWSAVTDRLGA